MQRTAYLFTATALLLLGSQLTSTADGFSRPMELGTSSRTQLFNFGEIYSALTSGVRVRFYSDYSLCDTVSGKLINSQGGYIDFYEALHEIYVNHSLDIVSFSNPILKLQPKIANIWSEYRLYSSNASTMKISTLIPATYFNQSVSWFSCDINDGQEGSDYYYSSSSATPSRLASYKDVYSTIRSGFVVTFTVDYSQCSPKPSDKTDAGGIISNYEDITVNNVNKGIQFAAVLLTSIGQYAFNQRALSLYQNGTLVVVMMELTTSFQPIVTPATLTCQINDGKNNGAVDFYTTTNSRSDRKTL